MAGYRQAAIRSLIQCQIWYMTPCCVTRPQRVHNCKMSLKSLNATLLSHTWSMDARMISTNLITLYSVCMIHGDHIHAYVEIHINIYRWKQIWRLNNMRQRKPKYFITNLFTVKHMGVAQNMSRSHDDAFLSLGGLGLLLVAQIS